MLESTKIPYDWELGGRANLLCIERGFGQDGAALMIHTLSRCHVLMLNPIRLQSS